MTARTLSVDSSQMQAIGDRLGQIRDLLQLVGSIDPTKLSAILKAFNDIKNAADTKGKVTAVFNLLTQVLGMFPDNAIDKALLGVVTFLANDQVALDFIVSLVGRATSGQSFPFAESDMETAKALGLDWTQIFSIVKTIISIISLFGGAA